MSDVAIVIGVGAEAGVGGALCRRFAREGMHVVVAGRTGEKIERVAGAITSNGGQATPFVMDATSSTDTARLFDRAEELGAPPKLVVYNAGNNGFSPLVEMSDAFFEDLWRICAFGAFLTGREAARRMIPAARPSRPSHPQRRPSEASLTAWRANSVRRGCTWAM